MLWVISTINLGLQITAFVEVLVLTEKEELELNERERNIALGTIALAILTAFLQILMALRLYKGAKNRDRKNIKIWLIISTITVIINLVSLIIEGSAGERTRIYIWTTTIIIIYKIYEIAVVFTFFKYSLSPRSQNENEVNEAVNSTPIALATISQPGMYNSPPQAQHHVYATQQLGPVPGPSTSNTQPREPVITFQSTGEVGWRQ
ncbi:unnamed protein product [Orchesella dallaii]|uniref:Transmembrane protein n=1 Tax=Orchesella dallaii TaxID=48710 RepID=A0ABP1S1L6_9HEXA